MISAFDSITMRDDKNIEMMKQIEAYIEGRLNQEQIDEMWIEFLKDPKWLEFAEIEVVLRSLGRKKRA